LIEYTGLFLESIVWENPGAIEGFIKSELISNPLYNSPELIEFLPGGIMQLFPSVETCQKSGHVFEVGGNGAVEFCLPIMIPIKVKSSIKIMAAIDKTIKWKVCIYYVFRKVFSKYMLYVTLL